LNAILNTVCDNNNISIFIGFWHLWKFFLSGWNCDKKTYYYSSFKLYLYYISTILDFQLGLGWLLNMLCFAHYYASQLTHQVLPSTDFKLWCYMLGSISLFSIWHIVCKTWCKYTDLNKRSIYIYIYTYIID
jgi:hypothetical protein